MGRRRKRPVTLPVFCYYCDREFVNEQVLIEHQKAKHFRCEHCERMFVGIPGLTHHMRAVHSEELKRVSNALPQRNSIKYNIYGMQNIPKDVWDMKMAALLPHTDKDEDQISTASVKLGDPTPHPSNSMGALNPGIPDLSSGAFPPPHMQGVHPYYAQQGYYYPPVQPNYAGGFGDASYTATPGMAYGVPQTTPQVHPTPATAPPPPPPPPPPPLLIQPFVSQALPNAAHTVPSAALGLNAEVNVTPSVAQHPPVASAVVTSAPLPATDSRTHDQSVVNAHHSLQSEPSTSVAQGSEATSTAGHVPANPQKSATETHIAPALSHASTTQPTPSERLLYRFELSMEELRAKHLSAASQKPSQ